MSGAGKTPQGPLQRAVRNAVWLLAGKGTGGVFSLVYLALAARDLGAGQFGIFALILTYGQAVTSLTQFQSWQTVVRYGAGHQASGEPEKLRRVISFAALLDFGAACAGTCLAIAGVWLIGGQFGWSAADRDLAMLFCLSLLAGVRGAPTGVLRLFDRFDLAAYAETVLPSMRLAGALLAWLSGAGIAGYLAAWAAAELITSLVVWAASARELHRRFPGTGPGKLLKGVVSENPGLWPFAWTTNFNASLNLVWKQLPVLVVGWGVDAAAAGGFRIAAQLVTALNKPTIALARAIYPEFARLAVTDPRAVMRTVSRACLIGAIAGAASLILVLLGGQAALQLIGGEAYLFAFPILLVLTLAATFDLSGVAIEPALIALGRPGRVLQARAMVSLVFAGLLVPAVHLHGAIGVAAATATASLLMLGVLIALARKPDRPGT